MNFFLRGFYPNGFWAKCNLNKWRWKKKKEKENQGNQCFDIVTTQGVFFQNVAIIYSLVSWKRKEGGKYGGKKKKRGEKETGQIVELKVTVWNWGVYIPVGIRQGLALKSWLLALANIKKGENVVVMNLPKHEVLFTWYLWSWQNIGIQVVISLIICHIHKKLSVWRKIVVLMDHKNNFVPMDFEHGLGWFGCGGWVDVL